MDKIYYSINWSFEVLNNKAEGSLQIEIHNLSEAEKINLQYLAYTYLFKEIYTKSEYPINQINDYYINQSNQNIVFLNDLKNFLDKDSCITTNTNLYFLLADINNFYTYRVVEGNSVPIEFQTEKFVENMKLKASQAIESINKIKGNTFLLNDFMDNLFNEVSILVESELIKNTITIKENKSVTLKI